MAQTQSNLVTQSPYFKPQAPISFGQPQPAKQTALTNKINPNIAQGLSIGSEGQALVNGAAPVAPPSQNAQTANALMGPLAPTTAVKSQTDAAGNTTTYHAPPKTAPTGDTVASGGITQPPPITGNYGQLADTGALVTPPSYPGIVGNLVNQSIGGNAQGTQATNGLLGAPAQNAALGQQIQTNNQQYAPEIAAITKGMVGQQVGDLTTGTAPVGEGNSAIAAQAAGQELQGLSQAQQANLASTSQQLTAQGQSQSALSSAGGLANTQQGLVQSGLTAAGGLAQPTQLPYSSQLVSPVTGQPVGGTGGTSGSLNDAVSNVIQQLQSGKLGYDDAKAQLAGYGQGGLNALSQWATTSGFNIAQSNTLAAQQGAITPNLNYANAALDNLENAMSNLKVWGQGSNIPILGGLANYFSTMTGVGKQQTATKAGAVGEAQQAIASVLASIKGGTPTDYGSQARALLPDDPTPADIAAAKANLTALGQQKQAIYSTPGQQTPISQTPTGGNVDVSQMNF